MKAISTSSFGGDLVHIDIESRAHLVLHDLQPPGVAVWGPKLQQIEQYLSGYSSSESQLHTDSISTVQTQYLLSRFMLKQVKRLPHIPDMN